MILLTLGADMLARLMAADARGPDTAWLLSGPAETPDEEEGDALPAE